MNATFKDHIISSTTHDVEYYKIILIDKIRHAINAWNEQVKKPQHTNRNVAITREEMTSAATKLVAARNMLSTLTEAFTEIESGSGVNLQGGRKSRRRKKTNQRR